MGALERIACKFNAARVEVMVLKGAALHLTLYDSLDQRPMDDLDLMVRPEDVDAACSLLEQCGGLRSESQVREDFFPRFHYEMHYTVGRIHPVTVDLHVRPFRPLRYARTVPPDAFWADATVVAVGRGRVLHPSPEDMLIHLLVHMAVHGGARAVWIDDIRGWLAQYWSRIPAALFLEKVRAWGLRHAVKSATRSVEGAIGPFLPRPIRSKALRFRTSPFERLALWQAPRDHVHPLTHVVVNTLCTPDLSLALSYLFACVAPDPAFMQDWYSRTHFGWLPLSQTLRWLGPLGRRIRRCLGAEPGVEVRTSRIHGVGVFATRTFGPGDVVHRYIGKQVERTGMYVAAPKARVGQDQWFELTGNLRFLNHACEPNARLDGFQLVAETPIRAGDEINIRYTAAQCQCGPKEFGERTSQRRAG